MNGERRMRLTERYMDLPGSALPDSLIVAALPRRSSAAAGAAGKPDTADKFKEVMTGKTEYVFKDGYIKNAYGGQ